MKVNSKFLLASLFLVSFSTQVSITQNDDGLETFSSISGSPGGYDSNSGSSLNKGSVIGGAAAAGGPGAAGGYLPGANGGQTNGTSSITETGNSAGKDKYANRFLGLIGLGVVALVV
ncbi:unnamed protein product [Ambrosiozyma monospora]|uniref:Unnamed protein product n=1 Tax=Ambrosiozyma monospora TaxID=43982 RepID=A0ACB5T0U9_AMBMO|nr:unnamed protein product [Ambrosiozyma monospora]